MRVIEMAMGIIAAVRGWQSILEDNPSHARCRHRLPRRMLSRPLIVRTCNWVGETVLSIPAINLLSEHGYSPQLVGKRWTESLLAGHSWPIAVRPGSLRDNIAQLCQLRRKALLVDPTFDRRANTLLLTNSFSSALEARVAGLRALGYKRDGRSLLLDRSIALPKAGHAMLRYWTLACRFVGIDAPPPSTINWRIAAVDQQTADSLIALHSLGPRFVLICPFAATQYNKHDKTWPAFAEFARAMLSAGHHLAACPGPGEAAQLRRDFPGVTLLADVGLGVYAGLFKRAALAVCNDTGPAHLAAAVGAPLLSLLGPTDPGLWAPWGPTVSVLRRWPQWPTVGEALERSISLLIARNAT